VTVGDLVGVGEPELVTLQDQPEKRCTCYDLADAVSFYQLSSFGRLLFLEEIIISF
jgi:hypothetical protein